MKLSGYIFLPTLLSVIGLTSCGQFPKTNKTSYTVDNSIVSEVKRKIEQFNKQANSNISFIIFENNKKVVTSEQKGEPGLSFTTFIDNSVSIECLNGIEDGFGFSLVINPDTAILRFKVISNSDQVQFRLLENESLQPEVLVRCLTNNITLANPLQIKTGEVIEGKVELESDNFYEVSKEGKRKLKFKLVVYFQSEPLPIIDKQYKTLKK